MKATTPLKNLLQTFIFSLLLTTLVQCNSSSTSSTDEPEVDPDISNACVVSLNGSDTDTDGDCILDDGDLSGYTLDNRCSAGETQGCDDNCPDITNSSQLDDDGDGVGNSCDNCVNTANADQADNDFDGIGDVCDDNSDADSIPDAEDNCPLTTNEDQLDTDGDGTGDACDELPNDPDDSNDTDGDGIGDDADNCPNDPNATLNEDGSYTYVTDYQWDTDKDGIGNECDNDDDGDEIWDQHDSCPLTKVDSVCNKTTDTDGDGINNDQDNCPDIFNSGQEDADEDGIGTACDSDDSFKDVDNDGIEDSEDDCPELYDTDNTCTDTDGDGIADTHDTCPEKYDTSNNCSDSDLDGILDNDDNCPFTANKRQNDTDGDGKGDVCDSESADSCDDGFDNDGDGQTDCDDSSCSREKHCDADNDGIENRVDDDIDGDGLPNEHDLCSYDEDTWYLAPALWQHDRNGVSDDDGISDLEENIQGCTLATLASGGSECVYKAFSSDDNWESDFKPNFVSDTLAFYKKAANYKSPYSYYTYTYTLQEYFELFAEGNSIYSEASDIVTGTIQYDKDGDGIGDNCDDNIEKEALSAPFRPKHKAP